MANPTNYHIDIVSAITAEPTLEYIIQESMWPQKSLMNFDQGPWEIVICICVYICISLYFVGRDTDSVLQSDCEGAEGKV